MESRKSTILLKMSLSGVLVLLGVVLQATSKESVNRHVTKEVVAIFELKRYVLILFEW